MFYSVSVTNVLNRWYSGICLKTEHHSLLIYREMEGSIEQNNTYPVKVAWGKSYHNIQDITEKFND